MIMIIKLLKKMKTEIQKVLNLKNFFNTINSNNNIITYSYAKASNILFHNIQSEWLQFIHAKTCHHFPVYLKENKTDLVDKTKPYGCINQSLAFLNENYVTKYNLDSANTISTFEFCFKICLPTHNVMQYFMQWQRYRKFWWSSITTTPSLFALSDVKHNTSGTNVNIVANFNSGSRIVETVFTNADSDTDTCQLTCKIPVEDALLTLLLDALNNSTKEEYLRFSNKMAPYKIALALADKDSKNFDDLKDLATLIMHKLKIENISTRWPDITLPLEAQVLKENFRIGTPYTVIIDETTLSNGIFQLLNSSTMLKEQLHLSDIQSYAKLLFGK